MAETDGPRNALSWLLATIEAAHDARPAMTTAELSVWGSMADWGADHWWGPMTGRLEALARDPAAGTALAWAETVSAYVLNSDSQPDSIPYPPDARRLGLVDEALAYMESVLAGSDPSAPLGREQLLLWATWATEGGWPTDNLLGLQFDFIHAYSRIGGAVEGSVERRPPPGVRLGAWNSLGLVVGGVLLRGDPSVAFPLLDGPDAARQIALVSWYAEGEGPLDVRNGWPSDPDFLRDAVRHRLGDRPDVLERLAARFGVGGWSEAKPAVDRLMGLIADGVPDEMAFAAAGL